MFKRHEFRKGEEKSAKLLHTPPVIHNPPSKELQELSYQRRIEEFNLLCIVTQNLRGHRISGYKKKNQMSKIRGRQNWGEHYFMFTDKLAQKQMMWYKIL